MIRTLDHTPIAMQNVELPKTWSSDDPDAGNYRVFLDGVDTSEGLLYASVDEGVVIREVYLGMRTVDVYFDSEDGPVNLGQSTLQFFDADHGGLISVEKATGKVVIAYIPKIRFHEVQEGVAIL